ncbi:thioredoxin family protein [Vallitalea okinawensis]|uniref:thioredoxin family protein n=1 Tax=Vallitalea okinawensis TaxID=2078660 RepID=UPI000CFD3F89|nr:thioredoxin family protein [Vallitalea okinawensis]
MDIKVLGSTQNTKSTLLTNNLEAAIHQLDINLTYESIKDLAAMNQYGVFEIPALVINDEIKTKGRIPSVEEVKELILALP